jgi:CobQ-like glutamine amidotransferase family enzyme
LNSPSLGPDPLGHDALHLDVEGVGMLGLSMAHETQSREVLRYVKPRSAAHSTLDECVMGFERANTPTAVFAGGPVAGLVHRGFIRWEFHSVPFWSFL